MKKYLYKAKGLFLLNIFSTSLTCFTNIIFALILKAIVDTAYSKDMGQFYNIILFSISFLVVDFGISFINQLFNSIFIKKVMTLLKNDIFASVINRGIKDFYETNSAEYISTLTNDISIVENDYFNNLIGMIKSILSFTFAVILIIKLNVYIFLGIIITGIITILIPSLFGRKISILKKDYSDSLSSFTVKIKDVFSGFEVIKSFNIESKTNDDFNKYNNEVENKKFRFALNSTFVNLLSSLFGSMMFFTCIGIGTYFAIKGTITIGSMLAAVQLMNNVVGPIIDIAGRNNRLKSVTLVEGKINELIKVHNTNDAGIEKKQFNTSIQFDNVSFSYTDERTVLDNISLRIQKGEKYAIVGGSGSGKSTVLKLLMRYFENYKGNILIDDANIKDIKSTDLYNLISFIQQNVFMFDCSIKDNITLYKEFNKADVLKAIKLSGLEELVNKLDDKEESSVGENGCNLSGGERQRIAIARAIIKNTPILVLDEATSSLDNETAFNIENSILAIPDLTCLVVTHKLTKEMLKKYNGVITIKDGKIAEIGSFEELMEDKGYFYSLYSVQEA